MGGCFRDRVSPIFILSGIWDIFLVRPAICCVKILPVSLCCTKIAFHTALAVQALAVKVLRPATMLRSFAEKWMVLPCRRFEGRTVFPADKDDRPGTATASPSSPCTTLTCKTAPLPSYSCHLLRIGPSQQPDSAAVQCFIWLIYSELTKIHLLCLRKCTNFN